jgi:biopolymer transport protein ExbD
MKPGRMSFRRGSRDEPEINLIPFIDVLLVVLIFLMLSTSYSRFTEMQVQLPVADVDAQRDRPREAIVSIAADGRYAVNRSPLAERSVDAVATALAAAVDGKDGVVVISADASSPHQSVITVMEAARRAGLSQITFATQASTAGTPTGPRP